MSVVLHWFLPTSGDSRTVVPFGPDGHRRPPTLDYLAQIARAADDLGYTGVLTPTGTWCEDAWLVTAALLARDEAAEVPRRVPPGLDLADARRAEGGDVPADLRWAAAAEHRHRWRRQRAATVRRLARSRRALRPHRRVPVGAARRADRAAVRLRGSLLPRRRGDRRTGARTDPAAVLRRRIRRRGGGRGQARRRLPRLGRAAGDGRASASHRMRELAAEQGRTLALRHPPARHHPRPRPRTRGPRPNASSTQLDPAVVTAAQAALAKSAVGRPAADGVAARRLARRPGDRTQPVGGHRTRAGRRRARRSSAATRRWPTGSRSTTSSASTSSSSPATRTSRRPTGSAKASCRSCAGRGVLAPVEPRPGEARQRSSRSAAINGRPLRPSATPSATRAPASIIAGRREPEVPAQGRGLVLGPQHAALLEQRHDLVDEPVEAGRREVRGEHEAVGAVGLDEVVHLLGDLRRRADERQPPGRLDDELADAQVLRLGERPPLGGGLQRIGVDPGAALDDRRRRDVGSMSGSGPSAS